MFLAHHLSTSAISSEQGSESFWIPLLELVWWECIVWSTGGGAMCPGHPVLMKSDTIVSHDGTHWNRTPFGMRVINLIHFGCCKGCHINESLFSIQKRGLLQQRCVIIIMRAYFYCAVSVKDRSKESSYLLCSGLLSKDDDFVIEACYCNY